MAHSTFRRRLRRRRRQMRVWDGFSIGIIAILAGITLVLASIAMRSS